MAQKRKRNVLTMQIILIDVLRKVWNMDDMEIADVFTKYNIMKYIDTCTELFNSTGIRGNINDIEEFIVIQGGCIHEKLREQQIKRRFPNQWLGLSNIQYNTLGEIASADVVYTDYDAYTQEMHNRMVKETKERLEDPDQFDIEVTPWYSGEPTLLDDIDVWEIEEKELPNFIGQLVDTRQLSKIYDIHILLSNTEHISFLNEAGEQVSFTEGILINFSKTKRGLGKKQPNTSIIFNSKQEARLQEYIELIIQAIDSFQYLSKFTNEQLLNYMNEHNTWESFDTMEDYTEFYGFDDKDILQFFNPSISNEEMSQLIKECHYDREMIPIASDEPIESLSEQSAYIIKDLIVTHKKTIAEAFKQWYNSKTKKFIEDHKLYYLTSGRVSWEYHSEFHGCKDEYLFQDLLAEIEGKNVPPKKQIITIFRGKYA